MGHRLVGAQLLLSLRQRCGDSGARREPESEFQDLRGCNAGEPWRSRQAPVALVLLVIFRRRFVSSLAFTSLVVSRLFLDWSDSCRSVPLLVFAIVDRLNHRICS